MTERVVSEITIHDAFNVESVLVTVSLDFEKNYGANALAYLAVSARSAEETHAEEIDDVAIPASRHTNLVSVGACINEQTTLESTLSKPSNGNRVLMNETTFADKSTETLVAGQPEV